MPVNELIKTEEGLIELADELRKRIKNASKPTVFRINRVSQDNARFINGVK